MSILNAKIKSIISIILATSLFFINVATTQIFASDIFEDESYLNEIISDDVNDSVDIYNDEIQISDGLDSAKKGTPKKTGVYTDAVANFTITAISDDTYSLNVYVDTIAEIKDNQTVTIELPNYMEFDTSDTQGGEVIFPDSRTVKFTLLDSETVINKTFVVTCTQMTNIFVLVSSVGLDGVEELSKVQIKVTQLTSGDFSFTKMTLAWNGNTDEEMNKALIDKSYALKLQFLNLPTNSTNEKREVKVTLPKELYFNRATMMSALSGYDINLEIIDGNDTDGEIAIFDISGQVNTLDLIIDTLIYGDKIYSTQQLSITAEFFVDESPIPEIDNEIKTLKIFDYITEMQSYTGNNSLREKIEPYMPTEIYENGGISYIRAFQRTPTLYSATLMTKGYRLKNVVTRMDLDETLRVNGVLVSDFSKFYIEPRTISEVNADKNLAGIGYDYTYDPSTNVLELISDSAVGQGYSAFPVNIGFKAGDKLTFDYTKVTTVAHENDFTDKIVTFRSENGPVFEIQGALEKPAVDIRLVQQALPGDEWGNYAPGNEKYFTADGTDQFLFTLDVYNKSVRLENLKVKIKIPNDVTITGVYVGGLTPDYVYPIYFYNSDEELIGTLTEMPSSKKFMFDSDKVKPGDYYVVFDHINEKSSTVFENIYHDGLWYDYGLRFYGKTNVANTKTFSIDLASMEADYTWNGVDTKKGDLQYIKGIYGGTYVGGTSITVQATNEKQARDIEFYDTINILNSTGTGMVTTLMEGQSFALRTNFGIGAQSLESNKIYYKDPVLYVSLPPDVEPNTGIVKEDVFITMANGEKFDLSNATISYVSGAKGYNAVSNKGSVYRITLNGLVLDEENMHVDVYIRFKVSGQVSVQTTYDFKPYTILLGTADKNSAGVFAGNYSGRVIKYTDAKAIIGGNAADVGTYLVAPQATNTSSIIYSPKEDLLVSYGILENNEPKYHILNTETNIERKTPESEQIMDIKIKHNASNPVSPKNPFHIISYFVMPNCKMSDGTILYAEPYGAPIKLNTITKDYTIYYTTDKNIGKHSISSITSDDTIVEWIEYDEFSNMTIEGITGIKFDIPKIEWSDFINIQFKFKVPHFTEETVEVLNKNSVFESQLGNVYVSELNDEKNTRFLDNKAMLRVKRSNVPSIISNLPDVTFIEYFKGDTTFVDDNLIPEVYDDMQELWPVTLDKDKSTISVYEYNGGTTIYTLNEWIDSGYKINNKANGLKTYTIKYISTDYDDSYQKAVPITKTIKIVDTANTIPHDISINSDKSEAEQSTNESISWESEFKVPSRPNIFAYSAEIYLPNEVSFNLKDVVVTGIPENLYKLTVKDDVLTIKLDYTKLDELKKFADKKVNITIPSNIKNQSIEKVGSSFHATAQSIVNDKPSTFNISDDIKIISLAKVNIIYVDSYTEEIIKEEFDLSKNYYVGDKVTITVNDKKFGKYYKSLNNSKNIVIRDFVEDVYFGYEKDMNFWKNVTVNLIDNETKAIIKSFENLEKIDVEKEYKAPEISGYKLVSDNSVKIIPFENDVVEFFYNKVIPEKPDDDDVGGAKIITKPVTPTPTDIVVEKVHEKYIFGYEDGSIRPDDFITRAEFSTIIYRLLFDDKTYDGKFFNDVSNDSWYANQINYLASIGIINGYEDGTFMPNNPIRRDEVASIVSRLSYNNDYTANDNIIIKDYWASKYIYDVYNRGIMIGYGDKTFHEDGFTTRADVAITMNRLTGRKVDRNPDSYDKEDIPFDLDETHYAYYDLLSASTSYTEYIKVSDEE